MAIFNMAVSRDREYDNQGIHDARYKESPQCNLL